jgi:hypothetical protein
MSCERDENMCSESVMTAGRALRQFPRPMTLEERVAGLEEAVIRLSNILELDGAYANSVDPARRGNGEAIHRWAKSVADHRAS